MLEEHDQVIDALKTIIQDLSQGKEEVALEAIKRQLSYLETLISLSAGSPRSKERLKLQAARPEFLDLLRQFLSSLKKNTASLYERSLIIFRCSEYREGLVGILQDIKKLEAVAEHKSMYETAYLYAKEANLMEETKDSAIKLAEIYLKGRDYHTAIKLYLHALDILDARKDLSEHEAVVKAITSVEAHFLYDHLELDLFPARGFFLEDRKVGKFDSGIIVSLAHAIERLGDLFYFCGHIAKAAKCYSKIHELIACKDNIPPNAVLVEQLSEISERVRVAKKSALEHAIPVTLIEHRERLAAIRAAKESTPRYLTQALIGFVENLVVKECLTLLGPAPCEYAFLSLGSLARNEACPYSDLEFAILVDKSLNPQDRAEKTLAEYIKKYFKVLVQLLELKVIALGESEDSSRGFCFDDGHNIPFAKELALIGTTQELLSRFKQLETADRVALTVLAGSSFMFGSVKGKTLFDAYRKELHQILGTTIEPRQLTYGKALAIRLLEDLISSFTVDPIPDGSQDSFSVKARLLYIPVFLAQILRLYYNINGENSKDTLMKLSDAGHISLSISVAISELIEFGIRLKHKTQAYYKSERDTAYLALAPSSGMGTYTLDAVERETLFKLYRGALMPASEMVQAFLQEARESRSHESLQNTRRYSGMTEYIEEVALRAAESGNLEKAALYLRAVAALTLSPEDKQKEIMDARLKYFERMLRSEEEILKIITQQISLIGKDKTEHGLMIEKESVPLRVVVSSEVISVNLSPRIMQSYRELIGTLSKLEYTQALNIHRQVYLEIPSGIYRYRYIECIARQETPDRTIALQRALYKCPDNTSLRESYTQEESYWRDALRAISQELSGDEDMRVILDTETITALKPEAREKLIAQSGLLQRAEKYGRHDVASIHGLHFKAYPELPGMEYAISSLTRHITGECAPYGRLVKFIARGQEYPVLVSRTIKGINLQQALKMTPSPLESLDMKSFSWAVISSLLINPEDGKPDNYMLEEITTPSGTSYSMVCIDNDRGFLPAVTRSVLSTKLMVKNIIYCMHEMAKPIHKEVVEEFLRLDFNVVLERWLKELITYDAIYRGLFPIDQQRTWLEQIKSKKGLGQASILAVLLKAGTIRMLYEKLTYLRRILKTDPEITHMALLYKIEPSLEKFYGRAHRPQDPFAFFMELTKGACHAVH